MSAVIGVRSVKQQRRVALRQTDHRPRVHELRTTRSNVRPRRDYACSHRRIQSERPGTSLLPRRTTSHLRYLLWVLGGDVFGLAKVLIQVVELEHLVVERIRVGWAERLPRCAVDLGAEQPAVVIERPLAHHLEVLPLVARGYLRVLRIEGVEEACAFDRLLPDTVNHLGRTMPAASRIVGTTSMTWMNCSRSPPLSSRHGVAGSNG